MFAIVETCGKQYKVEAGQKLVVDHIDAEAGAEISLDRVLLVSGANVAVGSPTVPGASVKARIVDHFLGEKVITFKYRRTRRYRRRVGYRHSHTTLEIISIDA